MRVVVLDDEPRIVELCVTILARYGYDADGFTSSADALAALDQRPADLLVVDYQMGEATGLDVTRAVRARNPRLPIIMITAHAAPQLDTEAAEAGVSLVLRKPFTPARLESAVAGALS